jgi:thioredoxin-like negative regulator of GroEL
MKKTIFIVCALLVSLQTFAQEQATQINFFKGTWAEAVAQAKATNKPIFADLYAEWCGPCKFMSRTVFTDKEVSDYYNQHFISIKIDAEKQEINLVQSLGVSAYPSLYYFYPDGRVLTKHVGAMKAKEFKAMGETVVNMLEIGNKLPEIEKAYQKNPNDMVLTAQYIQALTMAEQTQEAMPIAKTYLSKIAEKDLVKSNNWDIVSRYVNDVNSREFQYVINNAKDFLDAYGEEVYGKFVVSVLQEKLKETIANKDETQLAVLKKYYVQFNRQMGEEQAPQFHEYTIDALYYKNVGDKTKYFEALQTQTNKYLLKDMANLVPRIFEVIQNFDDAAALTQAQTWAATALKAEESPVHLFTMASVLVKQNKKAEAKAYLDKATQNNNNQELDQYIQQLRQQIEAK